ncbi:MAG: hypothetical protein WKF84_02115 [Pyrinomonadaceae bacterium]
MKPKREGRRQRARSRPLTMKPLINFPKQLAVLSRQPGLSLKTMLLLLLFINFSQALLLRRIE